MTMDRRQFFGASVALAAVASGIEPQELAGSHHLSGAWSSVQMQYVVITLKPGVTIRTNIFSRDADCFTEYSNYTPSTDHVISGFSHISDDHYLEWGPFVELVNFGTIGDGHTREYEFGLKKASAQALDELAAQAQEHDMGY